MAEIILGCRRDLDKRGNPVLSYSDSTYHALVDLGHSVTLLGEGHPYETFKDLSRSFLDRQSLFIDLDTGRNKQGNLSLHCFEERAPVPSAFRSVDAHGAPSLHKRVAKNYDHVFFAVFDKRDLFVKHSSSHWCPNASDAKYFYKDILPEVHESRPFDVGFFGSKHGLDRADILKTVGDRNKWKLDIRQLGKSAKRWPDTAKAMAQCKVLFNHGQKRDGPNQRVIESMLMERPLVTDRDPRDGMSQLFEEGEHFLGYGSESELANNVQWCLREPSLASSMAKRAYRVAYEKHQVKHRVEQILEVCNVG
ncbi:hypothetical protein LCGC14_0208640 [marine sediment metagenome]|uniref:Spore protein YkvP/CgeB glycosyl transferase-like domain-containing protein n=1 Tax=marine sediment metagenome TaxID=412755 RepID=A0A0F9XJY5_9ZZZZ